MNKRWMTSSMKAVLVVAALAVCTTGASATTATVNCPGLVSSGGSGSGSSSCGGFGNLGAVTINSVAMNWVTDFQYDPFSYGSPQVTFSIDAPGTSFDVPSILVNQGNRPVSGSANSATPDADYALLQAPFNVQGTWTAYSPITGTTMDFKFLLDYTSTRSSDVPEPATFAFMGLGLVGLGIFWRRPRS